MRIVFPKRRQSDKTRIEIPGDSADRELARGIGEGDRQALSRMLDRHLGPVHGYLLRRLGPGSEQEVAEIITATFEEAIRGLKPYATGRAQVPMRLWIIRLANKHVSRKRRDAGGQTPGGAKSGPELLALREALANLPARKQAALSLALFEELAPEDLAAALGVSTPRAMGLLRSALDVAGRTLDDAREREEGSA